MKSRKEVAKSTKGVRKSFNKPPATVKVAKPINQLRYSLIITASFFIVTMFGLMNHEMWRDEIQPWLIAMYSHSIPQLLSNMKYEGHPLLWHLILYFLTCFTHNIVFQQILHLLIACAFIFIFNRYSEIDTTYKILFTFGYFVTYEYSVINRDYGLLLLLVFVICSLFKKRSMNYFLLAIALALLSNVTIFGVLFAIGFTGILLLDYVLYQEKNNASLIKILGMVAIVAIGITLSLYQIWPDKNNSFPVYYAKELFHWPRWGSVASKLFITYFYIPNPNDIHFWNTNIYFNNIPKISYPVWAWFKANPSYLWGWIYMPIITFIASMLIFLRKPMILLLYVGLTMGILSLFYYTDMMHTRYCGHLLIALIVCYWLEKDYPENHYKNNRALHVLSTIGKKIQVPFLVLVLAANILGTVVAYSKDFNAKFSVAKDAADYIKANKLDTLSVAGSTDFIITPIAYYLDKKIFYPQMNDYGSYCIWNEKRKNDLPLKELYSSLNKLLTNGHSKLLLVKSSIPQLSSDGGKTHFNMEHAMIADSVKMDLIKSFPAGIVDNEEYNLYLVEKVDPKTIDRNINLKVY